MSNNWLEDISRAYLGKPITPKTQVVDTTIKDEWSPEARKAAAEARKKGGGGSSGEEEKKKGSSGNEEAKTARRKEIARMLSENTGHTYTENSPHVHEALARAEKAEAEMAKKKKK